MHPLEGHTVKRFDGELGSLQLRVLEMGGLVLSQVDWALRAIDDGDLELARNIVSRENDVDDLEVSIDEEIVTVIARRSPVARDLRALVSFSKATTDLERAGDEAIKLASLVLQIFDSSSADPSAQLLRDVHIMGRLARELLQQSLNALDRLDGDLAEKIALRRSDLDEEFQSSVRRLVTFIMEDSRNVGHSIRVMLLIKSLERIGDHARNIAEYVIYMVRGQDIRHQQPGEDEQVLAASLTP